MNRDSQTLRELVASYITEQTNAVLVAEGQLRDGAAVIHTTRVALRRLRSTLRVFGDLVDVPQAGRLEEELVWFAGILGEVRDLDVLETRLLAAVRTLPAELVLGPVEAGLLEEIAAHRTPALVAARQTLDAERSQELFSLLQRWSSDPPLTAAANQPAGVVAPYVRTAGRKLSRRLADAVAAETAGAPEADDLLHRARKAGKRHRYAAELAQPVLGSRADKIVAASKDLQDVLGDHQDSVVTAQFLWTMAARTGSTPGHNGFTFGLLYARQLDTRRGLAKRLKPFLS